MRSTSNRGAVRRDQRRRLVDTYMHSVGSVPLLTRDEELASTRRLERARIERRLAVWTAPWPTPDLLRLLDAPEDTDETHVEAARGRMRALALRDDPDPTELDEIQERLFEEEEALGIEREAVDRLADRARGWHRRAQEAPREIAHIEREARVTREALEQLDREIRAAEARIDAARNHLVASNLRLVVHTALKYRDLGLPLSDLMQEGNLGLMRGVDKFDHRRGFRLATYVMWWIRQSMTRALSDQSRTIRIPVYVHERLRALRAARGAFVEEHGRAPDVDELAEDLGLPAEAVRELEHAARSSISLETPVGDEEDGRLGDLLPDESVRDPADAAEVQDLQIRTQRALAALTDRQRHVIEHRFGIGQPGVKTLEQLGRELQLTRERVRQIQVAALRKLKRQGVLSELTDDPDD